MTSPCPCGLSKEVVLDLDRRNRVISMDGLCQNPRADGAPGVCGIAPGAHSAAGGAAAHPQEDEEALHLLLLRDFVALICIFVACPCCKCFTSIAWIAYVVVGVRVVMFGRWANFYECLEDSARYCVLGRGDTAEETEEGTTLVGTANAHGH